MLNNVGILKPFVFIIEEEAMPLSALFTIVFAPSLLLSQHQPMFLSFVTIPAVLSRCFMAMSLVRILPEQGLQGSKLRLIRSPMRLTFSPWRLKILV